jgi:outer membrane protein OmpA-like peptidoglycan-associated protein
LRTTRRDEARNWSLYLRRERGFKDAWVLAEAEENPASNVAEHHGDPRFESTMSLVSHSVAIVESAPPEAQAASGSGRPPTTVKLDASWTLAGDIAYLNNIGKTPTSAMRSSEFVRLFRFVVENAKGERVPSEVMLVNFEKIKKITGFQPGQNVAVKGTRPEQMVAFVCDVLGYVQETRMYNLDHLSRGKDITRGDDGVWEIRFKLKKMSVNDISVMNKTFFHKDAAILEESSRMELDELVALMKRNPGYKIILHSHCNGGVSRTLKFPSTDTNYFDVGDVVERQGSDKALTRERAGLIRNYLVESGIDKKRIGIVAWGSMEPVVTDKSEDAHINDRIELELTAE